MGAEWLWEARERAGRRSQKNAVDRRSKIEDVHDHRRSAMRNEENTDLVSESNPNRLYTKCSDFSLYVFLYAAV